MSDLTPRPWTAQVLVLPRPATGVSLLQPAFEAHPAPTWRRWWQRACWRRALARQFAHEPDGVLADFQLTRSDLEGYVAKPFWRR